MERDAGSDPRFREDEEGEPVANNYIVTAYQKEMI